MVQPATDYSTELESKLKFYLERLRKVDSILEGPVRTLVSIAVDGPPKRPGAPSTDPPHVYFPTWISETVQPEQIDHLLTQALCSGTLQRLWRLRRRFPRFKKSLEQLEGLQDSIVKSFTPPKTAQLAFDGCIDRLKSQTFGCLNPLTASQVFRVFLDAGEDYAHAPMGFLAFFAMVWPLYRRFPDPLNIGASIEPWEPTAYVTANCLLPIKTLQSICKRRARLLLEIADNLKALKGLARENDHRQRWRFNLELDQLSANLTRLSELAIVKKEFLDCSKLVGRLSDKSTIKSNNAHTYALVLEELRKTLNAVGEKSLGVLNRAKSMLDDIDKEIIGRLRDLRDPNAPDAGRKEDHRYLTDEWEFRFAQEYLDDKYYRRKYWNDLKQAAQKSLKLCRDAETRLRKGAEVCVSVKNTYRSVYRTLTSLNTINNDVADLFDAPVEYATRWCRNVVDREIAHSSAQNLTDFDPAELVSAIAVAVRWGLMTTSLQVSDAIRKALDGARPDGSWLAGQPFFSPNHVTGIWPVTSDIVWTLASAIEQHPDVDVADEVLFRYVDWLERTKTELTLPSRPAGWASDRLRHRRKIHLATTAYSINALLEIRDLIEHRLWQLCEQRFSVVRNVKGLKDIDPVDLGAKHHDRLHSHLGRMARNAQDGRAKGALYSLILHGPPGSSKTSVAEAISAEMWKGHSRWGAKGPRLLRITPADFTRMGEDRLDSEAGVIFSLLQHVRATTILFDEIDDLLRQRMTGGGTYLRFIELVVPAMLNRLADLRDACPRQEICFLLGTNYIEKIEPALIRKGRIDLCMPVVYPDGAGRVAMVGRHIEKLWNGHDKTKAPKPTRATGDILAAFQTKLATDMSQWPWQTIEAALTNLTTSLEDRFKQKLSLPIAVRDYEHYVEAAISENGSSFTRPSYSSRWPALFSQELFNEYLCHMSSGFENRNDYLEEVTKELPRMFPSKAITKADEERLLNEAVRVWNRLHS
jgi:hypothetical protein